MVSPVIPRQPGPYGVRGERAVALGCYGCDVLEMPAEAGWAVVRRRLRTGPVALCGGRMRFLIADGGAAELPGLLDWLEWGGIPLDLSASPAAQRSWPPVLWLRPPGPAALERLPAVRLPGCGGETAREAAGQPDLVRLVSVAATACHRLALLPPQGERQPFAFS